ncbi:XrtA system polysaccharide chain length determinant [Salinisphaera aquimarina]|uniref:XrtA system polysaccharide chain length determinant n=1 Tax=Salinisphaera aquimarina TaxID=2094031 RepID=A0ABV7ETD7_9GAMM
MLDIFNLVFEQIRNAWRFRWYGLAVAWAVAVCGWLFSYSLPNQYDSNARVHIDTQSAIHPLLNGMAVRPNVNQQVDLLIQTVLSRPNLETIARRTGLDLKASTPQETESLLAELGSRIKLRSTGGKLDIYRISFTGSDPTVAQNVVQQVINIMTGMAVSDGGAKTTQAIDFLSREVDEYKGRLDATERELATFKKNNAQLMPGSQDYVSRLQSLVSQIDNLRDELSAAKDRSQSLQGQVGGARRGGGTTTIAAERSPQVLALDKQISDRRNQIGRMLSKYTPKHPDVLAAQREVARLESNRSQLIAQLRANPEEIAVSADGGYSALRAQLDEARGRVSTLQASIKRKEGQLDDLKSGADDMTDAQAQLAELTRNYQVTRDQYEKLLTRLYSARLSEDVERSNNPLQFRVVDPPEVPAEPSGPNRFALITAALLGSLAAGGAFAFFMSQMRPVFINRRTLTDVTGLPVLGAVSVAWTRAQSIRRRTTLVVFMAGVGVLVVCYFGALVLIPLGVSLVPSFISGQWL